MGIARRCRGFIRQQGEWARLLLAVLAAAAGLAGQAKGAVISIAIASRTPWTATRGFAGVEPYERLQGRVTFAVDPAAPANAAIADLRNAPVDAAGKVEFTSDFVMLRPSDAAHASPSLLFDILNRGHSPANGVFFSTVNGRKFRIETPADPALRDAFAFRHGFTVVWLGWQFDLAKGAMRLEAPLSSAESLVREAFLPDEMAEKTGLDPLSTPGSYCAADALQPSATLSAKTRFEGPSVTLPRSSWSFARLVQGRPVSDPCSLYLPSGFAHDRMFEAVYQGAPAPVAGLGLAAVRDFVSYLKYGGVASDLLEAPRATPRVIGYGYSQSARFLRQYLYQGFTADEQGRATFDGLFIASAGAGRGSFNIRYAAPGEAGTSVLSDLRPVDMFPFSDGDERDPATGQTDGLLRAARRSGTVPRIFYTFSSSEYWQRFGSLAYTSVDGIRELPLDRNARLYFLAGTPHAHWPFPTDRGEPGGPAYADLLNFASEAWGARALLLDLDDWIATGHEPPPSAYPHLPTELVPLASVRFPHIPGFVLPGDMPENWRLDFGAAFQKSGVASREPPALGAPYAVEVPQVDADGNDVGGIALPFLAVPLGTFTGWNRELPERPEFHYLAGLFGGFAPFAQTRAERMRSGDQRLSIEERYGDRDRYMAKIRAAEDGLVRRRLLLLEDTAAVEKESGVIWDGLSRNPAPPAHAATTR